MTATPDYHINDVDIFRLSYVHLASHLPDYSERSGAYLQSVFEDYPQILIIQGLSPTEYTLISGLNSAGTLICGEYRKSMGELAPSVNAIWAAPNIEIVNQRSIRISELDDQGVEHIIAPDCIVITVKHRGRTLDIYSMESVPGVFNEAARVRAVSMMNRDAYLTKTRRKGHFDSLLIMAGNLHAEPSSQSVRYMEGYETIRGSAPSGWRDVWDELKMSSAPDHASTQRFEASAFYDDDIVLPQFMRGKRMSYFMVYNDVFGHDGTPVSIERNGTDYTDTGKPVSDTLGLDMEIYLPTINRFKIA